MSYTVENVNGCTKKFIFNFESLDLSEHIKKALVKKQKEVNLKGFRKGKAPLSVVEQMYRPQVENDALNEFIQTQFYTAIQSEKVQVVGSPSFEDMNYAEGNDISFKAVVEHFPEIELKDMSKLSFTKEKIDVTDEEVKKSEDNYLNSKIEIVEVEDPELVLAQGHLAILNFQGIKESGERPENMKGEDFQLEIGSGQFIPGFEDGMMGMKKGEKKSILLTFPAEYQAEELRNAKVTFETELLEIKEKKYPELTDELVKELGFENVDQFHSKNRETLMSQKDVQNKQKLHQEILEKIVDENPFEIPKSMIDQQKDHLKKDLENNLKSQGFTDQMLAEYYEKWTEDMQQKAIFQVKSGLILDKLAKDYNIETNDDDLNLKIQETAQSSGMEAEQIKSYYNSDEKIKQNLMYAIREEKTFAKISEIVIITEK